MSGIEIKNTSKNFGSVHALKAVSVHFEENKIYGLLGRNGSNGPEPHRAVYPNGPRRG